MISKDPSQFDLLEHATSQLDLEHLLETIETHLNDAADSSYFFAKSLIPLVQRGEMYMKINRQINALNVIKSITDAFATCVCEDENIPTEGEGADEDEKSERNELNLFVANLESLWEKIAIKFNPNEMCEHKKSLASTKNVIDNDEVSLPTTTQELFKILATWREALKDVFGPLFSDALRVLKKRIIQEEKKAASAVASTTDKSVTKQVGGKVVKSAKKA